VIALTLLEAHERFPHPSWLVFLLQEEVPIVYESPPVPSVAAAPLDVVLPPVEVSQLIPPYSKSRKLCYIYDYKGSSHNVT